ncbi:MAG: hypothetical protein RXO26_05180, partial [Caldivirga sp.]
MSVSKLVWVVSLIVLVIVSVAALILPTIHVVSKQGTPANSFSAPTPISPPINTSLCFNIEYAINPAVWFAYIPSNAIIRNGGRIQYFIGTFDHESGWI